MDICGDNGFEIIAKAKADLLESTNIETDEAEMAVIDNILFRCWQMGWLDRYDRKTEPTISKMEQVEEPKIQCLTCGLNKKCKTAFTAEARHCQNESRFGKDEPQTNLLVKTPRKSRESHEKNCETCRDKDAYDEWQGNCDECENGSMYTPQTERSRE